MTAQEYAELFSLLCEGAASRNCKGDADAVHEPGRFVLLLGKALRPKEVDLMWSGVMINALPKS